MPKFSLSVNISGTAFANNPAEELSSVFIRLAGELSSDGPAALRLNREVFGCEGCAALDYVPGEEVSGLLRESNGNICGRWSLSSE